MVEIVRISKDGFLVEIKEVPETYQKTPAFQENDQGPRFSFFFFDRSKDLIRFTQKKTITSPFVNRITAFNQEDMFLSVILFQP